MCCIVQITRTVFEMKRDTKVEPKRIDYNFVRTLARRTSLKDVAIQIVQFEVSVYNSVPLKLFDRRELM